MFIVLIPKSSNAPKPSNFCPISLTNELYKIISRILTARLKPLMHKIIHPCQTTFIPGRCISDNILLCHDIMRDFHLSKGKARMCLKIDLNKAVDSVRWDFLEETMRSFNLPAPFINWILQCVTKPLFSILVNGVSTGYFSSKRGLR